MKIIFFGTPSFVKPVLDALQKNFEVTKHVSALDLPKIDELKKSQPDLFVVAAYGKILPKEVLDVPKLGAINIHPSLLPKYRGPTPVQSAILAGEKKSGVSIIKLDEQVDHGPILEQVELEFEPDETSESFYDKSFKLGAEILPDVIKRYEKEEVELKAQDDSKATFTKDLKRDDGFIDPQNPPTKDKVERIIRAYHPWPGAWTKFNGKILKLLPKNIVQLEGKKPVDIPTFQRGYPDSIDLFSKLGI